MKKKNFLFISLALFILILTGAWFSNYLGNNENKACPPGSEGLLPIVCAAALIDCVNPCAFSVLLLTIAFLISLGALRLNIIKVGAAYIAGIFIVYFLIGLGLLKAFSILGVPNIMSKIGAVILIAVGLINLINVFWKKFPLKLKIPSSSHRGIARLVEKGSIAAAFFLGALVGVCEFPCTGGPYFSILGLLHDKATYMKGAWYLVIYNLIFIAPLFIILFIASEKKLLEKVEELKKKHSARMRLWSGLAMVGLGIIIFLI